MFRSLNLAYVLFQSAGMLHVHIVAPDCIHGGFAIAPLAMLLFVFQSLIVFIWLLAVVFQSFIVVAVVLAVVFQSLIAVADILPALLVSLILISTLFASVCV